MSIESQTIELLSKYNITFEEMSYLLKKHFDYLNQKSSANLKYSKSEKGKLAIRKAQRKYYYLKNDTYHPDFNPTGRKTRKSKIKI
tara:strand:+ start:82 stop:339 length:258 start_codon:yes stop_codon:yes gene_type:complete